MKRILIVFACGCLLSALSFPSQLSAAQVPYLLSYQGKVLVDGQSFTGLGLFKFVMINANGDSVWSNDGTSVSGSEPTDAVTLEVHDGLLTTVLGDAILGMGLISPSAFESGQVWLRIWLDAGGGVYELLTPDQLLTTVPYAMVAATVSNDSVQTAQLADASVTGRKLAPDSVTGGHIKDGTLTGDDMATHSIGTDQLSDSLLLNVQRLNLIRHTIGDPITTASLYNRGVFGTDGSTLDFQNGVGLLTRLSGGELRLMESDGIDRVLLESHPSVGGRVLVYQNDGDQGVYLKGDSGGAGTIGVYNAAGNDAAVLDGEGEHFSGELRLFDATGDETVQIYGGRVSGTRGGGIEIRDTSGGRGIEIYGEHLTGGGWMRIYKSDGSSAITFDSEDSNGEGRITTQVLEITGGSDLSEQFEIGATAGSLSPGMVVCIDPVNPGHLMPSTQAYDPKVAGIVSGAGGVKPGMLMGQSGSIADGRYPVALSGRVYCRVDATESPIQPGDLITTSNTPGHGMKATDPNRARGAIIGKAMTSLESGQGLALVLVSLQ